MGYVYEVSKEELNNIPVVSKEFIEECRSIVKKYKRKEDSISDCLVIGVGFSLKDDDIVCLFLQED